VSAQSAIAKPPVSSSAVAAVATIFGKAFIELAFRSDQSTI
jgi:hypothetical protein